MMARTSLVIVRHPFFLQGCRLAVRTLMEDVAMLNMDLSQRMVIETASQDWIVSPADGVARKPLERTQAESGHATSLVRFAPGSRFSRHSHPLGEEILVLEGVFSDEFADYPAGTYLRNPPGSAHSPFSEQGCTLLVKLDQFVAGDDQRVVIDTNKVPITSLEE